MYGSVARATDRAASDIELMLVSDSLSYGEVFGALERAAGQLGRPINPTVYTTAEFARRTRAEHAFVTRVMTQPTIWIIGGEDDLPVAACRLAGPGNVLSKEPPDASEFAMKRGVSCVAANAWIICV